MKFLNPNKHRQTLAQALILTISLLAASQVLVWGERGHDLIAALSR